MEIPEPGPERDKLIEEHVMGPSPAIGRYPPYSTRLEAAWSVLDKIGSWVGTDKDDLKGRNWVNAFYYFMLQNDGYSMHTMSREEVADLITRCALYAVLDAPTGAEQPSYPGKRLRAFSHELFEVAKATVADIRGYLEGEWTGRAGWLVIYRELARIVDKIEGGEA